MSKSQRKNNPRKTNSSERKFGIQSDQKNSDFYNTHKNTIWTIIVLVVLTIFFIVNNTREVPERGPYPPNYNKTNAGGEIQN